MGSSELTKVWYTPQKDLQIECVQRFYQFKTTRVQNIPFCLSVLSVQSTMPSTWPIPFKSMQCARQCVCVCIFFAPYTYECLFLISSLLQRAPGTRKEGTSGYFSKVVQPLDGVWLCGYAGMEFNLTSLWSGTGSARIPFCLSRSVMVRFTFH